MCQLYVKILALGIQQKHVSSHVKILDLGVQQQPWRCEHFRRQLGAVRSLLLPCVLRVLVPVKKRRPKNLGFGNYRSWDVPDVCENPRFRDTTETC